MRLPIASTKSGPSRRSKRIVVLLGSMKNTLAPSSAIAGPAANPVAKRERATPPVANFAINLLIIVFLLLVVWTLI